MPAGVVHGTVQTRNNDAVVTVTCKKGYKLIGSSMMYCNGKRWNSTIPMCKETDMRSSSLQKKNSETERTFLVANSLFKNDPDIILFNGTQNIHEHSEIMSIPKVVAEMWGPQKQLQSSSTFLEVEDEKSPIPPDRKGLNVPNITSTVENTAPTLFRKHITSSYIWSSTVTQTLNSKITQKINQSSQIKENPYLTERHNSTTGLLYFKDSQSMHSHFVKHEKNVPAGSFIGSLLHLGNTTPSAPQTTQQIQSKYLRVQTENKTPANMSSNNFTENVLAGVLETISKTIAPLSQLYNTTEIMTNSTNFTEDTNIKIKVNKSTPAQMLAAITPSLIYNTTLPAQIQTARTPIVEMQTAHVDYRNTTDQDTGHNATSADTEYKATLTENTNLSKLSNVKLYSIQKTSSTRTLGTTTATAINSTSRRNSTNLGILIGVFKRRVQCVYPPLPSHGTFRFLTIRNPLPNQYPYYIQYSCYPGYTMSTGDVHSFCKDNREWSGLTPVCELEENIPTQ
ncbi:uncharacterized protein [Dendrobates tinctorius]|uniref:uncharacterized protein n=1 Tax=Dendrobates tinctorius TaxID=92724 RepID=UPI003CCA2509